MLYVEPAKWVARLRATAAERPDVLLRTEMAAGHGGVSGRYKAWRDRAFTLAWMLDRMGLADRSLPASLPARSADRSPARSEKSLKFAGRKPLGLRGVLQVRSPRLTGESLGSP